MPPPDQAFRVTAPLPDESIISWLQASAERVLMSVEDWLGYVGVPPDVTRRQLLLGLDPEWTATLAAVTGTPPDAIVNLTLHGLAARLHAGVRTAAALGLGGAVSARYCPQCLHEVRGRWPLRWHTPWSFYCLRHDTFLLPRSQVTVPTSWLIYDDLTDTTNTPGSPGGGSVLARDTQEWLDKQLEEPTEDLVSALHTLLGRLVRADGSNVAESMGEPFRTVVQQTQTADHGPSRGHRRQGRVGRSFQVPAPTLAVATRWARLIIEAPTLTQATAAVRPELEREMRTVVASPHDRLKLWGGNSATLSAAVLPLIKGATPPTAATLQFRLYSSTPRRPDRTDDDVAERARSVPTALWPDATQALWTPLFGPLALFRRACSTALLNVGALHPRGRSNSVIGTHNVMRAFTGLTNEARDDLLRQLTGMSDALDSAPVVIDYQRRRALPLTDLLPDREWDAIVQTTGVSATFNNANAARVVLSRLLTGDALTELGTPAGTVFRRMSYETFNALVVYGQRWLASHGIVEPLTAPGPPVTAGQQRQRSGARDYEVTSLLLELDPTSRPHYSRRRRPHLSDDVLRTLYVDQRLTTYQIAERLNVSPPAVRRWVANAGVPRRPRGPASRPRPADQLPVADLPTLRRALNGNDALQRVERFATATQYPTMTVAARHMGVNLTTLTVQIQRIEQDLGEPIYERAERGRPQTIRPPGVRLRDELDVLHQRLRRSDPRPRE